MRIFYTFELLLWNSGDAHLDKRIQNCSEEQLFYSHLLT
jgi:hypothetical protein